MRIILFLFFFVAPFLAHAQDYDPMYQGLSKKKERQIRKQEQQQAPNSYNISNNNPGTLIRKGAGNAIAGIGVALAGAAIGTLISATDDAKTGAIITGVGAALGLGLEIGGFIQIQQAGKILEQSSLRIGTQRHGLGLALNF